jgi:hypothetical protein
LIPEDMPPPVEDELLAKLQDAIRRQLRAEGIAEGTPVSLHRYRQALLASVEASEIAHQIYEFPYVKQTHDQLPCGLKELAAHDGGERKAPYGGSNGNGNPAEARTASGR